MNRGQILVSTLAFLAVAVLLALGLLSLLSTNHSAVVQRVQRSSALVMAEGGIDYAVAKLNSNSSYAGDTLTLSNGVVVISVTSSGSTRTVDATAYIPNQANVKETRRIRSLVAIDSTDVAFNYGVQVGAGGLSMENNSKVIGNAPGVPGNVYSNGSIIGAGPTGCNGCEITGDAFVANGATLDQEWTIHNSELTFGCSAGGCNASVLDVAQSFSTTAAITVPKVELFLKKVGNPSNITLRILGNSSGSPNKNSVLGSGTLFAGQVSAATEDWITIPLSTPANLAANTTYWVMLDTSASATNYWKWSHDSNNGNGNGLAKTSANWNAGSPVWTASSGDLNYRIFSGTLQEINQIDTIANDAKAARIIKTDVGRDAYSSTFFDGQGVTVGRDLRTLEMTNCTVIGTAYYQIETSPNCTAASKVSGSTPPIDPPIQNLPVSQANITDWENDALAGCSGTCPGATTLNGTVTIGPIKYAGDLIINGGAVVTVNGPVWVAGDITIGNGAVLKLAPGFGNTSSVIIADDPANPTTKGTVIPGNGVHVCGSGGFNGTNCVSVAGSYLMILSNKDSTTTDAITINNGVEGAIFYAARGQATVYQNAGIKEVVAYRLILKQNAVITYEQGLADSEFASGPGGGWARVPGTWQIF
jgi:hypothetical protein